MEISRRQFLIASLASAAALTLQARADEPRYVQIGNHRFEVVNPSDTPTPHEYIDPSNTKTPLIRVPKELLKENLTKNFKLGEFARVSDPKKIRGTGIETHNFEGNVYHAFIRLDPNLPLELQRLRDSLGKPLSITSAYRPLSYNLQVSKASNSRHMSGQAADIFSRGHQAALHRLADAQLSNGGVGKYPTFVHIDTRGFKARW